MFVIIYVTSASLTSSNSVYTAFYQIVYRGNFPSVSGSSDHLIDLIGDNETTDGNQSTHNSTPKPSPTPITRVINEQPSIINPGNPVNDTNDDSKETLPLHVFGKKIIDSENNTITLRGVDYTYFMDSPSGSWMGSDGIVHWDTTPTTSNNWLPSQVNEYLDAMHSWGVNLIRCYSTVEWWTKNSVNFQSNLEYFIEAAASRQIYVDFSFWRVSSTGNQVLGTLPYPPYSSGYDPDSKIISSSDDFVNLWVDISTKLKDQPNVIFELWNEPSGNRTLEQSWFNVTQQCINAIRLTGATNLIDIEWGTPITLDFSLDTNASFIQGWDWIERNPLSDSLGNLIYDMHVYRENARFSQFSEPYWILRYTYKDVFDWLNATGTLAVSQTKPLIISEIGFDNYRDTIQGNSEEEEWFNNTLSIFDDYGIGYCAFAGPPWAWGEAANRWALVYSGQPNYQLTVSGEILLKHLQGIS